nr:putative ribonuclease H-like domain-containing protein [Tanacetum cinerariifolium]
MDVKSAFLYGTIDEEVYVMQPPGFQDPKFLAKVYKMEKAMYGLHQAPRAWYDSDFGGATQDCKSTTRGCQFLGRRLISWKCKKQTIMDTSITKAEYVAAASCCGQVLWIQNQLLDYGNSIMARLLFCDYHNMVAILEKGKHNTDFHPMVDFLEASSLSQYTRRTKIAQSSIPLTVADEPASPQRDVSQEEACPTDSDFIADQDKATIDKSSTLPHDSAPGVTSHAAIEGMEINRLKERVKQLEERERVAAINSRDDAPIKGRSMDEGKAATERVTTVLASGVVDVPTGSGSIPTASNPAEGSVPTGSEEVPIASPVFATATVMDAQVARELKEQLEKEDQRRAEQIARDAEIARIHAKEELQSMIDGLDSNNETIAKYLEEYHQFSLELPMERNGRS